MSDEGGLARVYLEGLCHLTGAESVSLLVPLPGGTHPPLLIHVGDGAPVAELADLECARRFLESLEARPTAPARPGPWWIESADADGRLAALPEPRVGIPDERRRRRRSDGQPRGGFPRAWLGMRIAAEWEPEAASERVRPGWWDWMMALGSQTAGYLSAGETVLRDPITGLPGRARFRTALAERLEDAAAKSEPLTLLLVNPDDFGLVNERFGQVAGDRVVQAVGERLRTALRAVDPVFRYGSVIFAALLDAPADMVDVVADKVISSLSGKPYLDGAVRLGFSAGIATAESAEAPHDPLVLARRATQALNLAKRSGGGTWVRWRESSESEERDELDRLTGIFTGNATRDYRNMLLLRDVVDIVAHGPDLDTLAALSAERLFATLRADRLALYLLADDDVELLHELSRRDPQSGRETFGDVIEERRAAWSAVSGKGRLQAERLEIGDRRLAYTVPLAAGGQAMGCLFLGYRERGLALGTSDLMFLESLGNQLAVALDHTRLAEQEARRRDQESRELRAEVTQLRNALEHSRLIYASPRMDAVVQMARRVAETEATVLVAGESGTGKELISRMLHELSPRADGPFVIVDCGAIAPSLIESELFGHVKGAYTGAGGGREGRLALAAGGTVLLDEIGELPLDMQTRLLRFVQDRQVTAVGGSKVSKVDVRIVAATNRDLEAEVARGRFREDLFFRLNVLRLVIPPLRERPEDVLPLARHFLKVFSLEYKKKVDDLAADAQAAIAAYSWPGNVRELQNRMMRGVILCRGGQLTAAELELPLDETPPRAVSAPLAPPSRAPEVGDLPVEELWSRLRSALARLIGAAADAGEGWPLLPLGRCLGEDLLLSAYDAAGEVSRRAAGLVGLADSTFRERYKRARRNAVAGLSPRPHGWAEVQGLAAELVARDAAGELLQRAEALLLEEIAKRFPADVKMGAELLGVTPATFRRRLAALTEGS